MEKLFIIIPAYNEEDNIENVAKEWNEILRKLGEKDSKLVIIDDGSKDNTCKKLLEMKAELEHLDVITKPNSGHGATILYGYKYALENGADYVFQTDSDGQTLPSEFWKFWENRNVFSAIIGYRKHREDGFSRILVTKTLKFVLYCIFGLKITDANTPFRLISRDMLNKYINQIPKDFNLTNVMLTVLLLNGKENVKFMPITFRPRQGGVNSINLRKITKIGIQAVKDFRAIEKEIKNNAKRVNKQKKKWEDK